MLVLKYLIITGKGILSEHEHFPSGASGQASLEYKCAYLCTYIPRIMIQLKYSYKLVVFWPSHMEIVSNQSGPVLGLQVNSSPWSSRRLGRGPY